MTLNYRSLLAQFLARHPEIPVEPPRRRAAHPPAPPQDPGAFLICRCFAVTDAAIREAVRKGRLRDVPAVIHGTRAGGGCGSCHPEIEDILKEEAGRS